MNRHCKTLLVITSLFAASSIIMASIGAHAVYEILNTNNQLETFNKAVDYSLYNAITLIGLAMLCQLFDNYKFHWAGYCIALGGLIFQTSLFLYTLAGINWITAVTPLGGILMIVGWLLIGVFAITTKA